MKTLFDIGVPHKFYDRRARRLICFLPNVRQTPPIPYYARQGWAKHLNDADLLYIADPFQRVEGPDPIYGSWFIDLDGRSILPDIARVIKNFSKKKKYDDVIFYGSSMGGYAGLIFGSLIPNSHVISECPQIYLELHPISSKHLNSYCGGALPLGVHTLDHYAETSMKEAGSITIITSIYDAHHVKNHIHPFMQKVAREASGSRVNLDVIYYSRDAYAAGHVALRYKDAAKYLVTP